MKKLKGPDFLIIGTQKGGTNSLYNYLIQHPKVAPASGKEIHYFDFNFDKGLDWYQSQFADVAPDIITGEGSPYYLYHPLVAPRLYDLYPQVKLIVLLRNPVERAISHYYWEVKIGCESLSLAEAIASESTRLAGETEKIVQEGTYYSFNHQHYSYLARGIYVEQLQNWMKVFPREQFLILKSEDFFDRPAATMEKVEKFLELPSHKLDEYIPYNQNNYPPVSDAIYRELTEYFQPYNQRLSEELGIDFFCK